MNYSLASTNDIPALCQLLETLFSQEIEFSVDGDKQKQALETILSDPEKADVCIVKENNEVLGMVSLLYTTSTALGGRVAILEDMIIAPKYQGKGLGSELINHAIKCAKEKDCLRITLLTDNDNQRAHRFYTKHGFEKSSMTAFRLLLNEKAQKKPQQCCG